MTTTNRPRASRRARALALTVASGVLVALPSLVAPLATPTASAATNGEHGSASDADPLKVCPVGRPFHFIDDFGAIRTVGGFHRHEGIDIFAARGTPVRAPFGGVATDTTNWVGGLAVTVTGAAGFVYEAHLERIGRLGRVRAGDVVGYVGNSGDAAWGPTHDHFEWHPGAGPAVDPYELLKGACETRPAAPERGRRPVLWRRLTAIVVQAESTSGGSASAATCFGGTRFVSDAADLPTELLGGPIVPTSPTSRPPPARCRAAQVWSFARVTPPLGAPCVETAAQCVEDALLRSPTWQE